MTTLKEPRLDGIIQQERIYTIDSWASYDIHSIILL